MRTQTNLLIVGSSPATAALALHAASQGVDCILATPVAAAGAATDDAAGVGSLANGAAAEHAGGHGGQAVGAAVAPLLEAAEDRLPDCALLRRALVGTKVTVGQDLLPTQPVVQWLTPSLRFDLPLGPPAFAALRRAFPHAAAALRSFADGLAQRHAEVEAGLLARGTFFATSRWPWQQLCGRVGALGGLRNGRLHQPLADDGLRDLWGELATYPHLCAMLAWTATGGRALEVFPSYAWWILRLYHLLLAPQLRWAEGGTTSFALRELARHAGAHLQGFAGTDGNELRVRARWRHAQSLGPGPKLRGAGEQLPAASAFALDDQQVSALCGRRSGWTRRAGKARLQQSQRQQGWLYTLHPGSLPVALAAQAYVFVDAPIVLPWAYPAGRAPSSPLRLLRTQGLGEQERLCVVLPKFLGPASAEKAAKATAFPQTGADADVSRRLARLLPYFCDSVVAAQPWAQTHPTATPLAGYGGSDLRTTAAPLPWTNVAHCGNALSASLGPLGALLTAKGLAGRLGRRPLPLRRQN